MNKYLSVTYNHIGCWDLEELELDLTKVHAWEIGRDILHVQKVKDGEWEQYEGNEEWDNNYIHDIGEIEYQDNGVRISLRNGEQIPKPPYPQIP
jgi:hypothetical protein